MINLISEFDVANMVHAVLADCEHRRPAISGNFEATMEANARRKLDASRAAFVDAGGDPKYWNTVEEEVLRTALPQYIRIAEEQNRLQANHYDVWHRGDLAARATFALAGLVIGGIIVAVPFIPITIDAFAFFLAICSWFYPDLKKLFYDFRYMRKLNAILKEAVEFQQRTSMEFLSAGPVRRMIG